MRSVCFTVPGKVGGKGRPRAFRTRRGSIRAYTPKKTRHTENVIRRLAVLAMQGKPILEGPLLLCVHVWRKPPRSWSKKRRATEKYVVGKPDADNILKLVADAAGNTIMRSDAQVAVAFIQRRWDPDREEVNVLVQTLDHAG